MSSGKIGVTMSIYGVILPGASSVASLARKNHLSKEAKKRLGWFDYYRRCGNARLTCRYFGISPQTFYRWKGRFTPHYLKSLEERSSRPQRVRQPDVPSEAVGKVRELREKYPRWGKDKLVVLLKREGIMVSDFNGRQNHQALERQRSSQRTSQCYLGQTLKKKKMETQIRRKNA